MAYCSLTDIEKLIPEESLIQLTDDEGLGTVNQGRIDEAIAQADSEIDAYLGSKYTIPLSTPVPDIVKKLSVDMAIYHLYSRRERVTETRKERYQAAIRLLEGISKGTVSIGENPEPEGETDEIQVSVSSDDRIFTKDKMTGY